MMLFFDQITETEIERSNVNDLFAANEKEDKLIASLEKKLGMKKRKNLPSKFTEDGLDCILTICEQRSCIQSYFVTICYT